MISILMDSIPYVKIKRNDPILTDEVNEEKDEALRRLSELEAKVERMQKYFH